VSRDHHDWRKEFEATLPDLREQDIAGSGFAITAYTVHRELGGKAPLARLRDRHARPVREHFWAGLDYQTKLARFLENHDEPRAAAIFPADIRAAATVITYLSPGLRFFHQGQFEGWKTRISPHLVCGPKEATDTDGAQFYERLLAVLREHTVHDGDWRVLDCAPAWEDNWTSDCVIAFAWQDPNGQRLLVAVNYAANQSQCYVRLPFTDLGGRHWHLHDLLGTGQRTGDHQPNQWSLGLGAFQCPAERGYPRRSPPATALARLLQPWKRSRRRSCHRALAMPGQRWPIRRKSPRERPDRCLCLPS
jgi:hypothetical protein